MRHRTGCNPLWNLPPRCHSKSRATALYRKESFLLRWSYNERLYSYSSTFMDSRPKVLTNST